MGLKKFRLLIVIAFLGIFMAKMIISVAPVFSSQVDKEMVNNVIMQVELEHCADHETGKTIKYVDLKLIDYHSVNIYHPLRYHFFYINNSYIEHFKRYVDPFHPSVPTPPPNLA